MLLIIGTNDMTANRSMSDCANDLRDLVDYMLGDMPAGGKVYMGSIPEFTMYGGNPEKIANYNNTVKSVANEMADAGKNVEFADVHGALDGMNDIGNDNLHPNGKGYEKIGKFWAETLDAYISSGSSSGQTEQPTQGSDPQQPTQGGGQTSGSADKSRTIKIMPAGDSITFGQGEDGGYRKYLDYFMKQKGYTGIDLVGPESTGWGGAPSFSYNGQNVTYDGDHAGYSGFTIKQQPNSWSNDSGLYEKLKNNDAIKKYKPDVVLLIIGTNDMTANRNLDDCASDLRTLVDYILADMPEGGKVYMGSIPEFTLYGGSPERVGNYNATVKKVADEYANAGKNVEFADVHGALDGMNDIGNDNLHPNGKGYEKMGKFWADLLDDYLSASAVVPTEPPTDPPTEPPTEEPVIAGDLDSDGSVTAFDLVFFRAGLVNGFSSNKMKRAADMDGSGTPEVNDIVLLSKYLLGQTA